MELAIKKVPIVMKKIGTKNYNRVDDSFDLFALMNINGEDEVVVKRYKYNQKHDETTADFIKTIKTKFMHNNFDSGTLSHSIVTIEKFDETEEKIFAFVKKANDKIKDFRNFKNMSYYEMNNTMNSLSFNF